MLFEDVIAFGFRQLRIAMSQIDVANFASWLHQVITQPTHRLGKCVYQADGQEVYQV